MTGTRQQWRHEPDLNAAQSRRRADRGTSWSSAHRGTEYRLIMASIVGLCAVGAAGSVVPGLDTAIGAVLVAAVLGALAVVAVRRQLRIRRRIADIDGTRPAVRPAAGATEPRVGPGVVTPVSPASITRAAHQLHPGTGPRAPRAARGGPRSPVHTARRCRMTTPQDPQHNTASTTQEIAALTARLRELSAQGRGADPAERAAFIADKDALIARITDPAANGAEGREGARATGTAREVPEQVVRARAVARPGNRSAHGGGVGGRAPRGTRAGRPPSPRHHRCALVHRPGRPHRHPHTGRRSRPSRRGHRLRTRRRCRRFG